MDSRKLLVRAVCNRASIVVLFANSVAAQPAAISESPNSLSAISLDSLHATREHPLFTPSRRPPAPSTHVELPESADTEPALQKPSVTLIGVLYGERLRIGIFANEKDKSIFRAHIGDIVSGWTLRDINRRTVLLEKPNERLTMELKRSGQGAVAAVVIQDPGISLHGTPVGQLIPFAKTSRSE